MKKKIIIMIIMIIIKSARFGIPARKQSVLSMKTLFYVKRERKRETIYVTRNMLYKTALQMKFPVDLC